MNHKDFLLRFKCQMVLMRFEGRGPKDECALDLAWGIAIGYSFSSGEISELQFQEWDRHPIWPKRLFGNLKIETDPIKKGNLVDLKDIL